MTTPEVTMCLCNYARPEQLSHVITQLKLQTVPIRIVVWDNSPEGSFKDDRADWVIRSSQNVHTRHIIYLWQEAETPIVGRMDDDLYPVDECLFEEALETMKKFTHPWQMLGAYGVRLYADCPSYTDAHHISTPKGHGQLVGDAKPMESRTEKRQVRPDYNNLAVDLLKGRFLLVKQEASEQLNAGFRHYHSDLAISAALAERRRRFHFVGGCFFGRENPDNVEECFGRLRDFPADELGYCNQVEHMSQRNELAEKWVKQCLPDTRVKLKFPGGEEGTSAT